MEVDILYKWSSLNQWDSPPIDACIGYKNIKTALSEGLCRYMLVKQTDQGGGYYRSEYIKKADVTPEMLKLAGSI